MSKLVNEVQNRIHDYFAVVLDDYHEVNDNPAINQLVDALLRYAPENLKLIVASRTAAAELPESLLHKTVFIPENAVDASRQRT